MLRDGAAPLLHPRALLPRTTSASYMSKGFLLIQTLEKDRARAKILSKTTRSLSSNQLAARYHVGANCGFLLNDHFSGPFKDRTQEPGRHELSLEDRIWKHRDPSRSGKEAVTKLFFRIISEALGQKAAEETICDEQGPEGAEGPVLGVSELASAPQVRCQGFHRDGVSGVFPQGNQDVGEHDYLYFSASIPILGNRSLFLFPRSHRSPSGNIKAHPIEVIIPKFHLLVWSTALFHAGAGNDSQDWRVAYSACLRIFSNPFKDDELKNPFVFPKYLKTRHDEMYDSGTGKPFPTRPAAPSETLVPSLQAPALSPPDLD